MLFRVSINIREETPADLRRIEAVTVSAFLDAPHTSHTEQHIINALRDAGKLELSLVAEVDGTVVGHVAISPVVISDGAAGWFGLGPISVIPECQRRGVGRQLMRAALRTLQEKGASGAVSCLANRTTTAASASRRFQTWSFPAFPPNTSRLFRSAPRRPTGS